MKKIRAYIPNVLLAFLLVFALIGAEAVLFVQAMLTPETFRYITKQEALGEKSYAALEKTFTTRAHSTGIPAEVFLDTITQEMMEQQIELHTEQAFAQLGIGESRDTAMEYPEMEASVRAYLENYADENGYEKDAAFEEKVASVTAEARQIVEDTADPFKLGTLRRNGWLDAGKRYLGYLKPAVIGSIALVILLMVLLLFCNLKQKPLLLYWYGLAALVGGVLPLLPCIYLKATDYFAAFAVKDPQIFAAVVGLLRLFTDRALVMAAVTAGCGVLLLIVFAIAGRKAEKEA